MILGSGLIQASGWPKASDWLIRDEFTDTVAAGSVNGTAATPGPGTRAATDTESKMSVASGVLAFAGGKASPAWGDPGLWYGQQARTAGLLAIFRVSPASGSFSFGFDDNTSGALSYDASLSLASGDIRIRYSATSAGSVSNGNYHDFAVVLRSTGCFYLARFVGSLDWDLLWVEPVGATTPLYPGAVTYNQAASIDYIRCIALPAPFDSDDGLATDTHSGSVAAGTTFTHEGNHILEYAATVPSGDNVDVAIRMQDADNYWFCRVNSSGDISLLEVIDGDAPVQRSTAAGVVSTGHRVVIIADGTTIKGYSNNTLRWTYSSATNFATATAGKVLALGTGGAVSDLKTWPRTLSGTAASILNKVSA